MQTQTQTQYCNIARKLTAEKEGSEETNQEKLRTRFQLDFLVELEKC